MEQTFVLFKDLEGNDVKIEVANDVVVTLECGDASKKLSLVKKERRTGIAIEDMTAEELVLEIRNAKSVQYKSKQAATNAGKLEEPAYIEAQAGRDARVNAAVELMKAKFPDHKGAKTATTEKTPRNTKLAKAEAIREALAGSDLGDEAKAAALAKMDELLSVLKTSVKKKKPAVEVAQEDATFERQAIYNE